MENQGSIRIYASQSGGKGFDGHLATKSMYFLDFGQLTFDDYVDMIISGRLDFVMIPYVSPLR